MALSVLLLAPAALVAQPIPGPLQQAQVPQPLAALSKAEASKVLPRELAVLSDKLPEMFKAVNRMARAEGLEGWPEPSAPFANDPQQAFDPFQSLHPTIYRIWGNVRVLWIYLPGLHRWDALLLMKVEANKSDGQYRMMWLCDAFGHPRLKDPASGQSWEASDVLEWSCPDGQDTTLTYARTLGDLQRSWGYTLRHSTNALICGLPESDAGQSYRFDPEFGLGVVVAYVGSDPDGDGSMAAVLTPDEFRQAKVLARRNGQVWVRTQQGLGVATESDWSKWKEQFLDMRKPQP